MGVVASWGARVFSVDASKIQTFANLTRRSGYKTESQEDEKRKPGTSRVAPELETITLTAFFANALGTDTAAEAEAWRKACDSGEVNALFFGGTAAGKNRYIIQSLQQTDNAFGAKGELISCKLELSFQEYRKEMDRKNPASTANTPSTESPSKKKPSSKVKSAVKNKPGGSGASSGSAGLGGRAINTGTIS